MPVKTTSEIAIGHYDSKADIAAAQHYDKVLTAQLDGMKADYAAFVNTWVPKREETKGVLASAGVSRLMWGFYLAFSAQLYKAVVVQNMSGESLAEWCQVKLTAWVARGLTGTVLEAIRTQVWNIEGTSE